MKAFRFRLERVLQWRRTELEVEEDKLKQLHAALAALDRDRAALESARGQAERNLLDLATVAGADLQALATYRAAVGIRCGQLAGRRRERAEETAGQQQKLLEARRRLRLLEKLRDRRLAEWRYASERS